MTSRQSLGLIASHTLMPTQPYLSSHNRKLCTKRRITEALPTKARNEKYPFEEEEDDRVFATVTLDNFKDLIKDEFDNNIIKEILDEYELYKYTTFRMPTDIPVKDMADMMGMSKPRRLRYFDYMFKRESAKEADRRKRLRKKQEIEEKYKNMPFYPMGTLFDDNNRPIYRKWHNSLFLRLSDTKLTECFDSRRQEAATFGQKLVFDFSYEPYMDKPELINLGDQMALLFGQNYRSKTPFDLWFCNYDTQSKTHEFMSRAIGNLMKANSFISLEPKSYLDVMPKKRLVYLSPHAHESYKFNEDDILIIGAFIDKKCGQPISFAKAKKEGLKMAKLPLDEHVPWGASSKRLTLNQMLDILVAVKETGDWRSALLNYVPKRKIKTQEQIEAEEAKRTQKAIRMRKNFFNVS